MPENPSSRILLVDDDVLFLKALSDTLRDEGYQVVAAQGGQAGIDSFHNAMKTNEPFALVITDLGMDLVDGRQVVNAVKSDSPSMPVILLTGWGKWFEAKGGITIPADYILAKPPKLSELRDALARCLKPGGT
jgi:DNA-binding response OmpR family regulator